MSKDELTIILPKRYPEETAAGVKSEYPKAFFGGYELTRIRDISISLVPFEGLATVKYCGDFGETVITAPYILEVLE